MTFGDDGVTGHPDHIALRVELPDTLLDRKAAALRQQASQTTPLIEAFGPDRWREWVRTETFAHLSHDTPMGARGRHMRATSARQGHLVTVDDAHVAQRHRSKR